MTVTSRAPAGGALMLNAGRRAGATGLWSAQAGRSTRTDTRTARGNRGIELSGVMAAAKWTYQHSGRASRLRQARPRTYPPHPAQDRPAEQNAMNLLPIAVERRLIEHQGRRARDACRRRHERSQAIVNGAAERWIDALQEVPERDRVLRLREREHGARGASFAVLEIESGERVHERLRRVLDVGNARPPPAPPAPPGRRPDLHFGAERHACG